MSKALPLSFCHDLAVALKRDATSFEAWHCAHYSPLAQSSTSTDETVASCFRGMVAYAETKDVVSVLHANEREGLFFYRPKSKQAASELLHRLHGHVSACTKGARFHVNHYDLVRQSNAVAALLMEYDTCATLSEALHATPSTGHEELAFEVTKRARKRRHPLYILAVEDEPVTQRLIGKLFKDEFAVIHALTAHEALQHYRAYAPDIVLLDIELPDEDGISVLRNLLAMDALAQIIMLSSHHELPTIAACLSQGASGFVEKPFRLERLRHYIDAHGKSARKSYGQAS